MAYDNTNRGALFTNKRRTKDTHPGFTGKIDVEGKEYWLSAWSKTSSAGERYMSLSVSPIEAQRGGGAPATPAAGGGGFDDFPDDDIPF